MKKNLIAILTVLTCISILAGCSGRPEAPVEPAAEVIEPEITYAQPYEEAPAEEPEEAAEETTEEIPEEEPADEQKTEEPAEEPAAYQNNNTFQNGGNAQSSNSQVITPSTPAPTEQPVETPAPVPTEAPAETPETEPSDKPANTPNEDSDANEGDAGYAPKIGEGTENDLPEVVLPLLPVLPDDDPTEDPAPEVTPELTPEPTEQPTEEPTPEPTPEVTPEPTPEPTPEANEDNNNINEGDAGYAPKIGEGTENDLPEVVLPPLPVFPDDDPTEDPAPEVTPEPTPEVTPEPTPEVTPEPVPEVTPEPTPEPTPEVTPEPTPEPTPDNSVTVTDGSTYTVTGVYDMEEAYKVLALVNEHRASLGLNELTWNENLVEAAKIRAAEISVLFDHTRPDGGDLKSLSKLIKGENIARGYKTAEEAFAGWMASAGHRENIERSIFGSMCVAFFHTDNGWYWVQEFGM